MTQASERSKEMAARMDADLNAVSLHIRREIIWNQSIGKIQEVYVSFLTIRTQLPQSRSSWTIRFFMCFQTIWHG